MPDHLTSSSRSSKYCNHCNGRTSLKPSRNAFICSSTPRLKTHCVIKLITTQTVVFTQNNIITHELSHWICASPLVTCQLSQISIIYTAKQYRRRNALGNITTSSNIETIMQQKLTWDILPCFHQWQVSELHLVSAHAGSVYRALRNWTQSTHQGSIRRYHCLCQTAYHNARQLSHHYWQTWHHC